MVSGFELTRSSSLLPPIPTTTTTVFAMKGNSGNVIYMVKNFFASSSDEEDNNTKEIEELDSPDYEPFMALFRRFRREQSPEDVKQYMHKGLCNIRENPIIMEIVLKLFDFEAHIEDIEKDVLFVKEKL